ncbi:hypothetical protein IST455A_05773 [Burkholderia multivorans]|nr:hypothetical protein IST419_05769 [Burkholderia multivorans]CAB5310429.1 hypothetical protein IST424_05754 [Burkholderia multivorans]CAB5312451.1 hypothetical protein IST453_05776 [Burkholderia multivorans]CAB5312806.1 hypothetical protein IST455A_05773 [Burkholderia multivorans]CAB5313902.1 hypothetical protein IST455B_05755 [Burkholderia multivorans]
MTAAARTCKAAWIIEAALETNLELAESGEPGVRALDDPAMPLEPLAAFDAATRYTGLDATLFQITPTTSKVIALVRMQFARTLARSPAQARHSRNRVKRRLECH